MYNYNRISTATTTLVRTGPCVLRDIIISGGTFGAVTVYDGIDATGDVVAVINTVTEATQLTFNVSMSKGITIVTAANTSVTVIY